MIYGVISDTHCHNWSTFSEVGDDYVNNRLQIILDEILRAATEVKKKGGKYLIHTGDLFHVRGNVSPSVLNPTIETFKKIVDMGINPIIICGNHDAEFRITNDVGSAVNAMKSIGCAVYNEPTMICAPHESNENWLFIPWQPDTSEFLKAFKELTEKSTRPTTLFCHVALDGVFSRLSPNTIVDHKKLFASFSKLKMIFAGHLHDHKKIDENCYSVGAIAQHGWGESKSKAGFLIVDSDANKVTFRASRAPRFVELTPEMDMEDIPGLVEGNYVRATLEMNEAEIKDYRKLLEDYGAAGVSIIAKPKPITRSDSIKVDTAKPLNTAVSDFIDAKYKASPIKDAIKAEAERIMSEI